jgi:hypothetical protein
MITPKAGGQGPVIKSPLGAVTVLDPNQIIKEAEMKT